MIYFERLSPPAIREKSVLAERIEAGLADPISDEERELAQGLRDFYERKFGAKSSKRNRKR